MKGLNLPVGSRSLSLLLLMLRIGTDDHDFASATNDFALLAHGLDRRSYLHFEPPDVFVST